jgi:hypothetical protein
MKIENDTATFSSGRTAYANRGIIGLSPELNLSEGYDGGFCAWPIPEWWSDEEKRACLQSSDMIELADYMISQWGKFKELVSEKANDVL